MLKLFSCLLTIYLAQAAEPPFWKTKAKVFERIQNHEVIVSVTALDNANESPRFRLKLAGGGHVNAPCDFVYKTAHNYQELSRLSGFVEKSQYDSSTHILDVTISAFFYRSIFKLEIEEPKGPEKELVFHIISGPMRGLKWSISFADVKSGKCEIDWRGEYKYDQFPIPKLFLEFGLEAIYRHMAERLRSFTEREYKKLEMDK